MNRRRGILQLVAVALVLSGCGVAVNFDVRKTLALGELQVTSTNPRLAREVKRKLETLNAGGSGLALLHLSETTERRITARTKEGGAAKIRLSYTLNYQLERSGQRQPKNGTFRLSQTIDSEDDAHLASRKKEERFFTVARDDSVDNLIQELILLFQP